MWGKTAISMLHVFPAVQTPRAFEKTFTKMFFRD
jgi:hypothetical protein